MGAQVLEVAEADVRQAHHDGDDQHHQGEQRGRRFKPCVKRLALLALAPVLQLLCLFTTTTINIFRWVHKLQIQMVTKLIIIINATVTVRVWI